MLYKLFRVMAMVGSGEECRRCSAPIAAKDEFGLSERVCAPCRA